MPKPIPPALAESMPESQAPSPQTGEVLRVLGGIGLPGENGVSRMAADGGSHEPGSGPSWEVATEAYQQVTSLFADVKPEVRVPGFSDLELAHINWAELRQGYETQERLGLEPELVIAPEGQPLSFWRVTYGNLRQWQDANDPDSSHRLQNRQDGDGLWVNSEISSNWDELTNTANPRWTVSVVPGTIKAPVLNVNHRGIDGNNGIPDSLIRILKELDTSGG
ncbi:MAG: hypothetical protein ACYCQJ_16190, partial [Nitrososphaerales archaeon]